MEVTGGFLVVAAALWYLDDQGVLLWGALACLCHELGHYAAIRGLGGRVRRVRLSAVGAEMALSQARPLGPGALFLAAVSGPVTNLALALLSARLATRFGEDWFLFAGLNLGLAGFNLLPVAQLDGGRAVYSLIALLCSQEAAERVSAVLSVLTAALLLAAGALVLWETKSNFTLLVTALWLTLAQQKAVPRRQRGFS